MEHIAVQVGARIAALLPRWLSDTENLPSNRVEGVVEDVTAKSIRLVLDNGKKMFLALSLLNKGDIRIAVIDNAGVLHETDAVKAPAPSPYPNGRIHVVDADILVDGTPYEYIDRCKSVLGGRWNKYNKTPMVKAWYYPKTPTMALALFTAFAGSKVDLSNPEFLALVEEGKRLDGLSSIKLADESELKQPVGLLHDLWLHQLRALHFASAMPGCGLFMDMGTGKANAVSSPVLTPTGWKRMGDIRSGDAVINSQGITSHVVTIHPQGVKPIFKVTFSDGASTRVTDDHLWAVYTPSRKYRGMGPRILTTNQIAVDLRDGADNCKHYIPMVAPVEFAKRDLPLDPYLLGVLLGDGSFATEKTITLSNPEPEIIAEVTQLLPATVTPNQGSRNIEYRLTRKNGTHTTPNPLVEKLRQLGLMGTKSATKFIPRDYLLASRQQREALLQGLLDTDGYVDRRNGTIEYVTISTALKDGVVELVQSFGGTATVTMKIAPQYTHNGEQRTGQDAYRVFIALPNEVSPFRLPRKAANVVPHTKYYPSRAIVSVEPDGEEEAQCITVDAADHLYVTDSYILTHNSLTTIAYILQNDIHYTLVVAPKSVVEVWPKEWAKHTNEPAIICALHKGTMEKRAQMAWDAYQEAQRTGTRLVVVVNYESARVFPFGLQKEGGKFKQNGIAFKIPWELLVLDESHKIKNSQSISAKFCQRIAKQVPRRLVLTGTPMPHDPGDVFSQFLVLDGGETFGTSFVKFRERYAMMGGYGGREILAWKNLADLEARMYKRAFRVTEDVVDLPEKVFQMRYGTLSAAEQKAYDEMEEQLELMVGAQDTVAGYRDEIAAAMDEFVESDIADLVESSLANVREREYVTAQNVLVKILKLAQLTSGYIATEDGKEIEIGHSKIDLLLDTVDDIKREEPLVIFARFTHDLRAIKKALTGVGYKVAELSGARNDLSAWQAGEFEVIVVQLQSGGVGVDFTRCGDKPCRYCIYYGKDFNWGNYKQSQKRIHRPGQTETTFFITLAMEGTVDIKVEDVLEKRGNLVEAVVNAHSLRSAEQGVEVTQEQGDDDNNQTPKSSMDGVAAALLASANKRRLAY